MRVLLSSLPAAGHLYPLVPFAWALRCAGHDVLVAAPSDLVPEATATGLPVAAVTDGPIGLRDLLERLRRLPWFGGDHAILGSLHDFATGADDRSPLTDLVEQTLPGTEALVRDWRPDVVLRDMADLTGVLACARTGVPFAEHWWGLAAPAPARGELRRIFGDLFARFEARTPPRRALTIDPVPPSFQSDDAPPVYRSRYVPYNGRAERPALPPRSQTPRICLSFGTLLTGDGVSGLAERVLDAAHRLGAEVVLAADEPPVESHPALLAAGRLPLDQVLASCDALVHHGGSGTMLTALCHGLPQLVFPHGSDHFVNADRLRSLHLAAVLNARDDPTRVERTLHAVLTDEGMRAGTRKIADEIAAQPAPADLVPLFEATVEDLAA
ncbi:L-noviosyl transferase [Saccharopolyspora erythraea NRRL 2338]|uniref:Glucosyltransferase n=2 Tax=Saccharopolyspora erythraea TaxID=1836 RepID=A4F7H2_SACEN|nr:nucleotide disphospho-sugar-binding domain-containing protein [Saccharopolyspora erythraea]PFG93798.1 L-noviosyl transferase [Saccharopolyspora erythraea NRRL 2338]CAL99996.1 putative glucosyltransferase [Saccharopolyspora erythraea NRRL 2338]